MQLEKKLSSLGGVPLTHGALVSMLKEYRSPNDKIVRLIDEGWLVPIKKGLYAVSPERTTIPISTPLVANLLYGPSCVSMDYALYHYGIIPERVVEVTSMTTRRGKVYDLPIGRFSYTHSPLDFYPVGIDRVENTDKTGFLMASPEKALCDKLVFTRNLNIVSPRALQDLLMDDLRLDEENITRFDLKVIEACIMPGMKERMLRALLELVNSMKRDLK
ncbi:conserved hypothetical protein [Pelodictyon phaeoclathratiforme BU-1]|uniref:Transcriptional regulator, AbiEi antitoxin, Type IV TA system n=2 Tax=Pelodictyon phaeoclathratiforme TaxID=34090 RepID=B4SEJ2_PELPB|nr:conserved hypothetical protein [Pelodictyon phaeoclathratiforme BU-1]